MDHLSIDIETRSSADISKTGAYRYAQDDDFEILLIAYKYNDEEKVIIDVKQGEIVPEYFVSWLTDKNTIKHAYNAAFEWYCFNQAGLRTPIDQWQCDMIHGLYYGYPGGLAKIGDAIGLSEDKKKMSVGKALIRYFCVPQKATKKNGGRKYNDPKHDPEKWALFKEYCLQDVETEWQIEKRLSLYPVPESEWHQWRMDVLMNAYGVRADVPVIKGALAINAQVTERLTREAMLLTHLENPNSTSQLLAWLSDHGVGTPNLQKETVKELLKCNLSDDVRRVLGIRQQLGKTSIKKYVAMETALCRDERIRGLSQFYGANRTGRWCLTGDHEVLTDKGWVRLDKWAGGLIACYNPKGEIVSFQKSNALCFDYEGDMYEYTDKRISQKSTPDHKMYVKKHYGGDWCTDTVANMANYRPSIPFTGIRNTTCNINYKNLRVLIMVQADGHFTQEGDLRLHFKKQRKIERCKHLLRSAEIIFTHSKHKDTDTISVKRRNQPLWLRMFRDKTFGPWLFDENPDIFFDELQYWDGYKSAKNSTQYTTCNKTNADMVQALAHMSGRCALISVKDRTAQHEKWSVAYKVEIWLTPKNCHEIRIKPMITQYSGKVYCAETKTGYFLVRRNGKVWVTGNSGRLVQLQNLPRNYLKTLDFARDLTKKANTEMLEIVYGDVQDTLSQLIRTAFIPSEGRKFVVADFSAIEARVIAWLAGEEWVNEVFATHGKIYEATASQMFHVPIEKIKKGNPEYSLRQKGKVATLALGYQGGVNALIAMGALKMGLDESELPDIVSRWRQANPRIKDLWGKVENAAITAYRTAQPQAINNLIFSMESDLIYGQTFLTVRLPSGRKLYYPKPFLQVNDLGRDALHFYGTNQTTGKWGIVSTYGGKLTENIVQAVARDCLAVTLDRINRLGYQVVFHVHDEVIIDAPADLSVDTICDLMAEPIPWAPGLILKGAGFESQYYMKD